MGLLEASFGPTVARSTDCNGPVVNAASGNVQQLLKSVNFVASINTDHERVAREQQTHSHFIPPPSSVVSLSTEWGEHMLVVPIRDNVHQVKGVVCPTQFRLTTEQAASFRRLKSMFKPESMLDCLSVVIYFVDDNELLSMINELLGGTSVWISQAVLKQITLTSEFPSFTSPFGQVSWMSRAQ